VQFRGSRVLLQISLWKLGAKVARECVNKLNLSLFFGIIKAQGPNSPTISEISPRASKMQTKRTAAVVLRIFEEA